MISPSIHIITDADLEKIKHDCFGHGVVRGKFEAASAARSFVTGPTADPSVDCLDRVEVGFAIAEMIEEIDKLSASDQEEVISNPCTVATKPVRHEMWATVFRDAKSAGGYALGWATYDISTKPDTLACHKIAWNSDGSPVADDVLQRTVNLLDEITIDRDMWKLFRAAMAARKSNPSMDRISATSDALGDTGMPPDETGDLTVEEVQEMLDAAVSKSCDNCGWNSPIQVGTPCVICNELSKWKDKSGWTVASYE